MIPSYTGTVGLKRAMAIFVDVGVLSFLVVVGPAIWLATTTVQRAPLNFSSSTMLQVPQLDRSLASKFSAHKLVGLFSERNWTALGRAIFAARTFSP